MHFTASKQELPESATIKAKLAWHYYYRGYELVHTKNNYILVTRNNRNLDEAIAFSSESEFVSHLERRTDEALRTDKENFLRSLLRFPELLTQAVISALEQELSESASDNTNSATDIQHE